jgi:hypothetical protein
MSAFKRHPSKVFWDQMALHNLGDERFLMRSDPLRFNNFNERLYREDEEEEEENSISKSENDTTDNANITAIHICIKNDESSKQDACRNSLKFRDESVTNHKYVEE